MDFETVVQSGLEIRDRTAYKSVWSDRSAVPQSGLASLIVRSVTRGLCRTVAKAASVSGYSASKCGASFVHMWLDCKRGSRGNG